MLKPARGAPWAATAAFALLALLAGCVDEPAAAPQPEPPQPQPQPQPPDSLTVRAEVAPGDECPTGGTRRLTGVDDDRSGTLEPAEIDTTELTCHDNVIFHGDLVITQASELAQLDGVTELDGSLRILALPDLAGAVDLPLLARIDGDFQTESRTLVVNLAGLFAVGGDLRVSAVSLTVPALQEVGGDLALGVDFLSELPVLRVIGGDLTIGVIQSQVVLPALDSLGGGIALDVHVFAAPVLRHAASLTAGGGIETFNETRSISLPALSTVDAGIFLYHIPLAHLELPALRTASVITISYTDLCASTAQELAIRTGATAHLVSNRDC